MTVTIGGVAPNQEEKSALARAFDLAPSRPTKGLPVALGGVSSHTGTGGHHDRIDTLEQAAHFLRQAALGGGTLKEIERVKLLGSRKAWLLEQIHTPEAARAHPAWTGTKEDTPAAGWVGRVALRLAPPRGSSADPAFTFPGSRFTDRALLTAFMANASESPNVKTGFTAPDETFRMKATWALSKFIPCSVPGGAWDASDKYLPILGWYASLHRFAFKNYADLLEEVTYSPAMSRMLTFAANEKSDGTRHPDENYAREIMQLFTIGLWELNIDGTLRLDGNGDPVPTYGQADIEQMARVFTGLCRYDQSDSQYTNAGAAGTMRQGVAVSTETTAFYDGISPGSYGGSTYQVTVPGVMPRLRHYAPFYETGAKVALGGLVNIPANTEPRQNIKMAIKALVEHPSCAPFVAKNLIKHTITSNPSPAYVARVAMVFEDDGFGVRGNLAAVWEAIMCDQEATHTVHTNPTHGRLKDGVEVYASNNRPFFREAAIPSATGSNGVWIDQVLQATTTTGFPSDYGRQSELGAWFYSSPSIFGFNSPEFTQDPLQPVGLHIPEAGARGARLHVNALNTILNEVTLREPRDAAGEFVNRCVDYAPMLPVTGSAEDLVSRVNLLLCGGSLSQKRIEDMVAVLAPMPVSTSDEQQNRVAVCLQLAVFSTEFWVM